MEPTHDFFSNKIILLGLCTTMGLSVIILLSLDLFPGFKLLLLGLYISTRYLLTKTRLQAPLHLLLDSLVIDR